MSGNRFVRNGYEQFRGKKWVEVGSSKMGRSESFVENGWEQFRGQKMGGSGSVSKSGCK